MTRGIMPGAVWRPVQSFGYGKGTHNQNVPLLFVDHIMSGWKSTMDRPGWQEAAGISATFGVGDDGSISQYVNLFDASWANGVVGAAGPNDRRGIDRYNRSNPRLAVLERNGTWRYIASDGVWTLVNNPGTISAGANAWNTATVTIEHENLTGVPWSDAKMNASVAIKQWVNEELAREGYATIPYSIEGIIGHGDIDAINRAQCPGTGRDLDKMLALLNGGAGGEEMQFVRHVHAAAWFENRDLSEMSAQEMGHMQAISDFALPPEAKDVEFVVYLDSGRMSFQDGGAFDDKPRAWCGDVGNRGVMVGQIRAQIGVGGDVSFTVDSGTKVGRIVSLGYWKSSD